MALFMGIANAMHIKYASLVIELLRKTHWLADGMKATDSECDDRMLAINP